MLKGFHRFYLKEEWRYKNLDIEDSLYTKLKDISENELDASINKLVDACIENFNVEGDTIIYHLRPENEIICQRTIRIRQSMLDKLENLKNRYGISIYRLVNIAIKYTLDNN